MSSGEITGRDPATGSGIAIVYEAGVITRIDARTDAPQAFLSAGLVDLQVNGYAGLDINVDSVDTGIVSALCRQLAAVGTTTFLPTLITASREQLLARLKVIADARKSDALAERMIPGIHVEGPSISPLDGARGAHPAQHVRLPSLEEFEAWQEACGGLVSIVTIAPEHAGAMEYIAAITQSGVHVSLGHTAATPEQIHAAADAGARLSTHLGNGAAAVVPRHPNFIWAQLADDRLTPSFIADRHHLPPDAFKAMLRAKGVNSSILVSDSVALAGMPAGRYTQAIGGDVDVSPDGRIRIVGTPYLAGAGLPLHADVAIATDIGEISLDRALVLATRNPGNIVGGRGRLEVGAPADIIRFTFHPGDRRLAMQDVLIAGERIL